MKTKLHGLLTDLIEAWALVNEIDDGFSFGYGTYDRDAVDRVGEIVKKLETIVRPGTNPDSSSFEGHPPGNDFEGDDNG